MSNITIAMIAARASGKLFMLGMNQRFRPDSQKIRSLVGAGVLGEVYHGKAFWFRRSGIPRMGTWFGNRELAGGGCLLDIGVHLLDLCLFCMDNFEPVAVSGSTYTKFGNRGLGEGGWIEGCGALRMCGALHPFLPNRRLISETGRLIMTGRPEGVA